MTTRTELGLEVTNNFEIQNQNITIWNFCWPSHDDLQSIKLTGGQSWRYHLGVDGATCCIAVDASAINRGVVLVWFKSVRDHACGKINLTELMDLATGNRNDPQRTKAIEKFEARTGIRILPI